MVQVIQVFSGPLRLDNYFFFRGFSISYLNELELKLRVFKVLFTQSEVVYLVIIFQTLGHVQQNEKSHVTSEYWRIMYDWRIQERIAFSLLYVYKLL